MKILKYLKKKMLIITPNDIKMELLQKLQEKNEKYDLKFMDFEEFKKHIYFDYNMNTVGYLMDKYGYKIDICKMYLDNMYYLEDKVYASPKLNNLQQLKKELVKENLLLFDPFFNYYVKQVSVVVYGYEKIDCFMKRTLSELENMTKVTIVEEDEIKKDITVYEFSTMEEEVTFVACSILKLVRAGTSMSNIKLVNVSEEYYDTIKRVFSYYYIPVSLDTSSIYGTEYIQMFLKQYQDTKNLIDSYTYMVENFQEEELREALLNICNQIIHLECSFNTKWEILVYLLKQTKIKPTKQKQEIEIISCFSSNFTDDEYVFLMGVNQNVFPKLYKDEDYIGDKVKDEVYLSTTKEKNKQEKIAIKKMINRISNIVLSYKLKSPFQEYYPSSLLEEINCVIIKDYHDNDIYTYSHLANEMKLVQDLDRFRKFHEKDDDLELLYNNYKDIAYLTYQNQFTGISKQDYLEFIDYKLLLSFTSMNQYQLCNFRYYLNYVLKLKPYDETFATYIGNLYHKLLSLSFLSDFNFDKEFEAYKKTRSLTVKEVFLLNKLKKSLLEVIKIIKKQKELTNFKNELYEKEIFVSIPSEIKVLFKGTIDKIMYLERMNDTYISLIDYKSGAAKPDINNMIYGIDMQLPVYLYLVKKSNLFPDIKFVGFYLQKVLHGEILKKENVTLEKQKQDRMKLMGYSTDDENSLEQFDVTYQNSEMIHGMKMTSKGFSSYSKVLTDKQIDDIIQLTEEQIKKAVRNIVDANFTINPKRIGKEDISCTYCPFADICYHSEEDVVILKEYKDLSFLDERGAENG